MPKKQVLVAVDGGGSKTEYCIKDTATGLTAYYTYGSTNHKAVGEAQATQNLVQAFAEICTEEALTRENIIGVVLGLSGCDSPDDYRFYRSMTAGLGLPEEKVFLCNDCELAFLAAAQPPGICIVAGTGSIAIGFDQSKIPSRCGGWGGLLSDEGSGFWIAQQVLSQMLRHCDGMGEEQAVFELLRAHYGIPSSREIPFFLTALDITQIASAARLIMDFAAEGDLYCREVVSAGVDKVVALAKTLHTRMAATLNTEAPCQIVLTGSLFKDAWFRRSFKMRLTLACGTNFLFTHITQRTSENAMCLAQRLFGTEAAQNFSNA